MFTVRRRGMQRPARGRSPSHARPLRSLLRVSVRFGFGLGFGFGFGFGLGLGLGLGLPYPYPYPYPVHPVHRRRRATRERLSLCGLPSSAFAFT